ncbi:MAG TPA: hypothetical protein DIW27_12440 [Cytophagales bacterium]|nr:hypothetical protein [Cytophagales bacterium]
MMLRILRRVWLIATFSLFLVKGILCQNLIKNPSLEDLYSCPDDASQLDSAKYWFTLDNPTMYNSPDLIATCAENSPFPANIDITPDSNWTGFQKPFHGNNYLHIIIYKAREFASIVLTSELETKDYCLSFYISTTDKQACAINRFGALFTKEPYPPSIINSWPNWPDSIPHQFEWRGGIISDTLNWQRVWGTFTASGGEKYMHVGNFYSDKYTDTLQMKYGLFIYPPTGGGNISYCSFSSYYFDYFELYELPTLITPNDTVLPCSGSINLAASGADTYSWLNTQGDTLSTDSVFLASPTETTTYTLHTNQCRKKAQKNITVAVPECIPVIPNIITPGGNGLNDFLVIKNLQPGSSLSIYNRWGNVLFESKDYQQNWDCNSCSDGTYFYVLITPDGKQYKGTVTVLGEK